MRIDQATRLQETDSLSIYSIWNAVYPDFLAHATIDGLEAYLTSLLNPSHFLLRDEGSLKGWLCTFDRNGERWFVMIIHPSAQKRGFGTSLISKAMALENTLSGWVVEHNNYLLSDGSVYVSPLPFYSNLGFQMTQNRFDDGRLKAVQVRWENRST
ncbi:MAG: GNAT family N-acetyltransferase [Cryomorphaceae bacterium]